MGYKLFFLSIVIYLIPFFSYSQECTKADVIFTLNKIIADYPATGKEKEIKIIKQNFEKLQTANNCGDCFKTLANSVCLLKDLHLFIYNSKPDTSAAAFGKWIDLKQLNKQLENQKPDNIEGYWLSSNKKNVVGIIKTSFKPLVYTGYIIKTANQGFKPGMGKFSLTKMNDSLYNTILLDESFYKLITLSTVAKNKKTILLGGDYKWEKINKNKFVELDTIANDSEALPAIKRLNKKTMLLTLKDLSIGYKTVLDSVLNVNQSNLYKSKNLIIDVRNNVGGSVYTYYPLLKYLYTNPIYTTSGLIKCSQDYINQTEKFILDNNKTLSKKELTDQTNILSSVKKNIDGYFLSIGDTLRYDSILSNPKNVAIITNWADASSGELFLLDATQSKKVKIYGENTCGSVDYGDVLFFETPSANLGMYIPSTKSVYRSGKNKTYDLKGIQPTVLLDLNYINWLKFINQYMK